SILSPIPIPPGSTLFPYTTLFRSRFTPTASARSRRNVGAPLLGRTRCILFVCASSTARRADCASAPFGRFLGYSSGPWWHIESRSEEHTSELQSRENLVCRLLLEK